MLKLKVIRSSTWYLRFLFIKKVKSYCFFLSRRKALFFVNYEISIISLWKCDIRTQRTRKPINKPSNWKTRNKFKIIKSVTHSSRSWLRCQKLVQRATGGISAPIFWVLGGKGFTEAHCTLFLVSTIMSTQAR